MKFKKIAVGGTFDYIHDGHLAILAKAFELGEHVLIGITSSEMQLVKDSAGIPPLEVRRRELLEVLSSHGWVGRAEVYIISDPFGPAVDNPELEAIVVSPETRQRAEEINKFRNTKGFKQLEIIDIPFVLAEDGLPISSIRIRYGEIDVHGKLLNRYAT
jgi:pantetheine-phosphate adenylyltransferase